MGWSITLITDRAIAPDDAESVIAALPDSLRHPFIDISKKQEGGWVAATDIHNPEGERWRISGSYGQSGGDAPLMADALSNALRSLGYTVTIDYHDY